jgi:hypothetical protein
MRFAARQQRSHLRNHFHQPLAQFVRIGDLQRLIAITDPGQSPYKVKNSMVLRSGF